ncbi:hypothetical protein DFH11DRAFT_1590976 [Phellopilus nigrolimitatus]|nr:hypothetical protein DFH11DRAFT_1590976 [Phellopilus nigrolimitatus]
MFNVASLKDKAASAKNSTVNKFHDTRDRYSSTPMAQTRFAEGGHAPDARKAPPPPPPMRAGSHASRASTSSRASEEGVRAPPPVLRSSKPALSASPSPVPSNPGTPPAISNRPPSFSRRAPGTHPPTINVDTIDWANLSSEDKQEFFSWLDEFFARFLHSDAKPVGNVAQAPHPRTSVKEDIEKAESPQPVVKPAVGTRPGPPPAIKSWSKPVISPSVTGAEDDNFETSYPPRSTYGCQALDLAYYFHPDTHWDTAWYAEQGAVPPPLRDNPHRLYKGQYTTHGDTRGVHMGVLFADLSVCWFSVSFSASNPAHPARIVERTARYLPPPPALDGDALVQAHETYGETAAGFAEGFLGGGSFCARGECWDLANEALKYFEQFDYVDAPLPSLNRTHGHLIFSGRALGPGRQAGRWRGGDDRVRRGDIVEWRSVRINFVGAPPGSYAFLGDPEHTAIITADAVPTRTPRDGESVLPGELRQLEVVEQSRNQPPEPKKQVYDMAAFEEGEVWIYRPVSMQVYLGIGELVCEPAPQALSI